MKRKICRPLARAVILSLVLSVLLQFLAPAAAADGPAPDRYDLLAQAEVHRAQFITFLWRASHAE